MVNLHHVNLKLFKQNVETSLTNVETSLQEVNNTNREWGMWFKRDTKHCTPIASMMASVTVT